MRRAEVRGIWVRIGGRWGTAALAASTLYLAGCGGDSGGGGSCQVAGCGGDIKGTWTVTQVCAHLTNIPMSTGVAACDAVAKTAADSVTITPMGVTLTFTDTTYSEVGKAEIQIPFTYTKACLTAQGAPGASADTCSALQSGLANAGLTGTCMQSGDTCACSATESLDVNESGSYQVEGTNLVMGTDSTKTAFCVQGNTAIIGAANDTFGGSLTLTKQ